VEIMIIVLVVIAALLTVVAGLAWVSISSQIRTLNDRIKDYYLITPDSQRANGIISAQLYEAMKDVCAAGKAQVEAADKYKSANNNDTSLVSDVAQYMQNAIKADKELIVAVDRLEKIEKTHEIVKG